MISYYLVQVILLYLYIIIFYILYIIIFYILYYYIIFIYYILLYIIYYNLYYLVPEKEKSLEAAFFNCEPTLFIKHILKHIPNCLLLPNDRLF